MTDCNHHYRAHGQRSRRVRKSVEVRRQRRHSQGKYSRHIVQTQSEKVFHLGAGNQDGNAISESHHYRPRYKLHRRPQPGYAHNHQQNSGHHRAHKQTVHPVDRDDPRDHHHKGPSRAADLRLGASQHRDQKSSHNGAINARLRG